MSGLPDYTAWGLAGLLLCAALLLLRRPLAQLIRLALRSSVGLAVLALFSQIGRLAGISLGVNLVNALVLGLLGVPGFGLLLMLQWVLR
ncbi:pro-sigmaK processing inhibitor BofA family protein [Pseudoflavonifractor phocaeensis]|uniref:pro-sigmaK processing inhibitor BofA family protein n=1 Tax=Pseudoflavonifractor phocaeensis TaxID=1870988 RepID=UPI001F293688|nr:pro-sigmaK processing inhibitor BofA family protein [Pseudoflavonifractor phocaeensis]MCF2595237.1 pro-sigmaK processing inhibitor BofA family protein [Pseudoflavonifractor phocaeensis]